MTNFNPEKLHVLHQIPNEFNKVIIPRKYTLTHSDSTGDLFLTIGKDYDIDQISNLYTRFMRDEVIAEWLPKNNHYELHLYVHVSGGLIFGWARLRDKIFRNHLPLVLQTIVFGDKKLFEEFPSLKESQIFVHFKSTHKK
ncbi:MAG: staygreen family protein [Promethearchaeota archaeon]|nr:MAG: staygreen family protein [Candidatus Lokiarchaeota archaeon]